MAKSISLLFAVLLTLSTQALAQGYPFDAIGFIGFSVGCAYWEIVA